MNTINNMMNAQELYDLGISLRQQERFGEAINAFRKAAVAEDATDELIKKSLASVELIQEIKGFVNKDLMNP